MLQTIEETELKMPSDFRWHSFLVSAGYLPDTDDIAYLYRLAQENPLLYAELACKPNGLQEYVDAMNEFN